MSWARYPIRLTRASRWRLILHVSRESATAGFIMGFILGCMAFVLAGLAVELFIGIVG